MSEVTHYNYEFRGMIERPDGQFVFAADYYAPVRMVSDGKAE